MKKILSFLTILFGIATSGLAFAQATPPQIIVTFSSPGKLSSKVASKQGILKMSAAATLPLFIYVQFQVANRELR